MELVDWYISNERKHWIRHRLKNPLRMNNKVHVEITFNQEILYLHKVLLNKSVEAYSVLKSWKNGTVSFCLPPEAEELDIYEVDVQWS